MPAVLEQIKCKAGVNRKWSSRSESTVSTLVAGLKSCNTREHLDKGRHIHLVASENGDDSNTFVAGALLNMYIKCGSLDDARRVFQTIPCPDVVSWTCLISGYAQSDCQKEVALELFQLMHVSGCSPNARTFVAALKACSGLTEEAREGVVSERQLQMPENGIAIHARAAEMGFESDVFVATSLISMYSAFGCVTAGRRVFDRMRFPNTVSWNALMLGYAENGQGRECLVTFNRMHVEGRCVADSFSYFAAIRACITEVEKLKPEETPNMEWLEIAMALHSQAAKQRLHLENLVGSSLVELYSKCGSLIDAHRAFDRIVSLDELAWTALISGYILNDEAEMALILFTRMQESSHLKADEGTLAAAIKACTKVADMQQGRKIQAYIHRYDVRIDAVLGTSVVNLYSKCGRMIQAEQVFESYSTRDLILWNALMSGFSRQGDSAHRVLELFRKLQEEGLRPDGSTFVCVLTACSHAGLIDKGKRMLHAMRGVYRVEPGVEHLICIADSLARADQPEAVLELLGGSSLGASGWDCVLSASRKLNNPVLGRIAFGALLNLQTSD